MPEIQEAGWSKTEIFALIIGLALAFIGVGQNMSGIGNPLIGLLLLLVGLEVLLGCALSIPAVVRNIPGMFRLLAFIIISSAGLALLIPALDGMMLGKQERGVPIFNVHIPPPIFNSTLPQATPHPSPLPPSPTIIQVPPATLGNLKERATKLSYDMMQDLWERGWYGWQQHIPPDYHRSDIPKDAKGHQLWDDHTSAYFEFRFLQKVKDVRAELAELHFRDAELDEFLKRVDMIQDANRELAANGVQQRADISAMDIERASERLRVLADLIPETK